MPSDPVQRYNKARERYFRISQEFLSAASRLYGSEVFGRSLSVTPDVSAWWSLEIGTNPGGYLTRVSLNPHGVGAVRLGWQAAHKYMWELEGRIHFGSEDVPSMVLMGVLDGNSHIVAEAHDHHILGGFAESIELVAQQNMGFKRRTLEDDLNHLDASGVRKGLSMFTRPI